MAAAAQRPRPCGRPSPTLILWHQVDDQPIWADAVTELKVGFGRAFSASTLDSLVADLRLILAPECVTRAREVAAQMTTPAESAARTADLLEEAVRLEAASRVGSANESCGGRVRQPRRGRALRRQSVGSCSAEVTTYVWRSRPTCLISSRRLGLAPTRLRAGFAGGHELGDECLSRRGGDGAHESTRRVGRSH